MWMGDIDAKLHAKTEDLHLQAEAMPISKF
jgi:hypothetical protein